MLSSRHTAANNSQAETMAKQAADHHRKAAEHHAHLAHGYSSQAIHHGTDAAKAHGEHHGEAEQIMKDGGRAWLLNPCSLR
jgi:hypothetical protein